MEYERLLEITISFAGVFGCTCDCEEVLWQRVKELNMTPQEMQEIGLQRYEVFSYPDTGETDNKFVIWDNLTSDDIKGLVFKSEEEAKEMMECMIKNELEGVQKCENTHDN